MPATITINRAPVLLLWAAVVAQRLGFRWDESLSLGKALAGLNAQSKGRRLGIFKPHEEKTKAVRERERGEQFWIELCGRPVPAKNTADGIWAVSGRAVVTAEGAETCLETKFGQLETAALALAQMRNLRTMRVGELASDLRLSAKQERELLSRMSRSGMIANVRKGLYLFPPRLPLGGIWTPDEATAINSRITADDLARAAVQYGNMGTIRRIGVILERIDASKAARSRLERAVTATTAKIPLVPTRPARGPVSSAWGVVING